MVAAINQKTKVLLIHGDGKIRRLLRGCLERAGYAVAEAASGDDGIDQAADQSPAAVLLDTELPGQDGLAVLRRLREWTEVPILVVSADDTTTKKISALDAGANDYILQPFHPGELLARLRVALRSPPLPAQPAIFRAGNLTVDLVHRHVKVGGRPIKLSATEYSLLQLFVRHAGKVLTHEHLLQEIWGSDGIAKLSYLRVYLTYLRKKLGVATGQAKLFVTETGVGYRLAIQE